VNSTQQRTSSSSSVTDTSSSSSSMWNVLVAKGTRSTSAIHASMALLQGFARGLQMRRHRATDLCLRTTHRFQNLKSSATLPRRVMPGFPTKKGHPPARARRATCKQWPDKSKVMTPFQYCTPKSPHAYRSDVGGSTQPNGDGGRRYPPPTPKIKL